MQSQAYYTTNQTLIFHFTTHATLNKTLENLTPLKRASCFEWRTLSIQSQRAIQTRTQIMGRWGAGFVNKIKRSILELSSKIIVSCTCLSSTRWQRPALGTTSTMSRWFDERQEPSFAKNALLSSFKAETTKPFFWPISPCQVNDWQLGPLKVLVRMQISVLSWVSTSCKYLRERSLESTIRRDVVSSAAMCHE